jgi:rubrerythrin
VTPEDVIRTALNYGRQVAEVYEEAVSSTNDEGAMRFFQTMHEEEKLHIDYLERNLILWQKSHHFSAREISSVIPSAEAIVKSLAKLKSMMTVGRVNSYGPEVAMLKRALKVEEETTAFYRRISAELPLELQQVFQRFLEIEDGHRAAIEAELDAVQGHGFWFDIKEFTVE